MGCSIHLVFFQISVWILLLVDHTWVFQQRSPSSIEIPAVLLNQRCNPLEMAFIVVTGFPIEQRDGGKCISMQSKTDSTKTQSQMSKRLVSIKHARHFPIVPAFGTRVTVRRSRDFDLRLECPTRAREKKWWPNVSVNYSLSPDPNMDHLTVKLIKHGQQTTNR